MAGGKYLQQKPQKGGNKNTGFKKEAKEVKVQKSNRFDELAGFDGFDEMDAPVVSRGSSDKKGNGKKITLIILLIVLILLIGLVIGGIIYYNTVLNMMSRPDDVTVETLSDEEINKLLGLDITEEVTTSPEETWPEIVSDQNITNIMLIGQAAREGEDYRLSDSNILVSINRETKTVTLTSIIRDLLVQIPSYEGRGGGRNRINVVYHLGSYYTGEKIDSMKMMEKCIQQNFGVKVDHTVEIDFEIFCQVVDLLGGVEIELSEEEVKFMKYNYNGYDLIRELKPGVNKLDGYCALCYARLRKVGNGDWDRTARQRLVITKLVDKLKNMGIMDVHELFKKVLPNIFTDMTNEEITNYAFELIPMLTGLTINSQTIPFEGTWWSKDLDPDGVHNYAIECDLAKNGKLLRESIGYVEE